MDIDFNFRLPLGELCELAQNTLAQNKDCFVAQWILQNPDANVGEHEMLYQMLPNGEMSFRMRDINDK